VQTHFERSSPNQSSMLQTMVRLCLVSRWVTGSRDFQERRNYYGLQEV